MAGPGVNLAITKDGGAYNKLQRPQDYLMSTTSLPPPKTAIRNAAPSLSSTNKRKEQEKADNAPQYKRARVEEDVTSHDAHRPGFTNKSSRRTGLGIQVELPGLEGDWPSDGDVDEAVEYLRGVRSEASTLPTLLVADAARDNDNGAGEGIRRALYRDGTWIAVEDEVGDADSEEGSGEFIVPAAQARVYQLFLRRFKGLRDTLAEVSDAQSTSKIPGCSPRASATWLDTLGTEYPKLEHVARLNPPTVYAALEKATDDMAGATTISPQLSCWIWTLLALVGDAGTLDNDKMSCVRDVGQKVGLVGVRLRVAGTRQSQSDKDSSVADSGSNGHGAVNDEKERALACLLAQMGNRLVRPGPGHIYHPLAQGPKCIDVNTQVTVDMVLTVVGEYFGQRDLLKYREQW